MVLGAAILVAPRAVAMPICMAPVLNVIATVLALSDQGWIAVSAMVTSVVTTIGGVVILYLRLRSDMEHAHEDTREALEKPRRIGARAGDNDPVLLPPDPE